ncbi:hypothetical protein [Solicola sp. PLA-1-18]|uniref:hypothetical protein n=1 Tax=Solicola sp. PLA-1-18 TaxID=3380532 RepID=UPI003B783E40
MNIKQLSTTRKALFGAGSVIAGGAVLTAVLLTGGTASGEATDGASASTSQSRSDETPLTGTTAAKVKAAALAKYPGATVDRLETDSDGVYEAHLTTTAGQDLTVQVDKAFKVTGTQTGRGGHGGGNETPLTGTTAAKVKAAVLAKYPGATIERATTDDDGTYEAHITTKAGDRLEVQLDKAFAITGTQTGHGGRGGHGGGNETPLTGTTAAKVKAAVLAKYPGATIERATTDDDGTYEAHVTTKAGDRLEVQLDKAFAITGTQTGHGRGGHHGDDD